MLPYLLLPVARPDNNGKDSCNRLDRNTLVLVMTAARLAGGPKEERERAEPAAAPCPPFLEAPSLSLS